MTMDGLSNCIILCLTVVLKNSQKKAKISFPIFRSLSSLKIFILFVDQGILRKKIRVMGFSRKFFKKHI